MSDHAGDPPKPAAAPVKGAVQVPSKSARPLRVASVGLVAIVVLIAVGLAVATHRGAFNGSATLLPQDRLANLEARVNQLAGNQTTGAAGTTTGDAANLKERVDALEARLSM